MSQNPTSPTSSGADNSSRESPDSTATSVVKSSLAVQENVFRKFMVTNVVASLILTLSLIGLVGLADYKPVASQGISSTPSSLATVTLAIVSPTPTVIATASSTISSSNIVSPTFGLQAALTSGTTANMLIFTLVTLVVAGALGAVLCNLRGIFTYTSRDEAGRFPAMLLPSYQVRPFIGAITGLSVFFLAFLLGGPQIVDATTSSWVTLAGRLPYVGLAILAGFASQEFMQKLKDIVVTIFSTAPQSRIQVKSNGGDPSKPNVAGGGGGSGNSNSDGGPRAEAQ